MFTRPDSTGPGFAAFEDASGTTALWHLAVYGICVPAVERVDLQSADDSSNAKAVEPHCTSGQRRLGVGFDIVGAAGQAWPYRMALKEELFLNIFEATEDNDGYGSNWYLLGHSICSTPLAGEVTVEEIGPLQPQRCGPERHRHMPAGNQGRRRRRLALGQHLRRPGSRAGTRSRERDLPLGGERVHASRPSR